MKNNRNINALNLILLMILSLTFISTAQAQFHFRIASKGLFVTKGDKIDRREDKFVADDGTLTISSNEAICERNICVFKIGFIISREFTQGAKVAIDVALMATGDDDVYVKQNDVGSGQVVKALISFPELSKTQSKILPLKLNVGKNKVRLVLNDGTTIQDGESNDLVMVTINVIPNRTIIPGKQPKDWRHVFPSTPGAASRFSP